ncbi:MAG: helix-turn-helix domain-containing protein [Oscillospiraceae bacterium]
MDRYILDGQYGKYLEMAGIRVGEALKRALVPEDLFSHKQPVLDEAAYYRFMEAVGEQITDPNIPIMLVTAENIERFSPPIFATYCSKNAEVCLNRLKSYKRIIAPMRYEITVNEDGTTLEIAASSDELKMPRFLVKTEFLFIVHIIRSATKSNIIPLKAVMQKPVTDKEFIDFLGCAVEKGAVNSVLFSTEDMHKPFISRNDGMWDFFEPELQKRLYEMERDDSFSAKVRSALTELLPAGKGTADEVAAKLYVSRRTLQRKLKDEGTTFQQQLNGVREMLARHYIRNTEMSGNDIAFLLGYSEVNSFLRAFSLWTGMSVSEYRKRQE